MRRSLAGLGLAGLGFAGYGLYSIRRQLLARSIGLRPAEYQVGVTQDLFARMPDGTKLFADRFFPRADGTFPTILIRTPYGRPSETHLLRPFGQSGVRLFAERGYNVVVQSVRGRFRSEGTFEPFVHEAADGRATLEWIADQPWFDGNLGMWGPSYLGYTQWAVAADAPPYLKALVPIITSTRFSHALNPVGSFAYETALRWTSYLRASHCPGRTLDLAAVRKIFSLRRETNLRAVMTTRPFAEADRVAIGETVPFFQRWLNEPDPDGPYWRGVDHDRQIGRVGAAVHLVAGWYDFFLLEQLADYTDLLAAGRIPSLSVLQRSHTDPRLLADCVREGLWWFDAHLKGRRELLARRAVRLRLMGAPEQHEMDFWPPPGRLVRYFLQSGGGLSTEQAGTGRSSSFRYDPQTPTPSLGGPVLSPQAGPRDQRPLEARSDLLVFTSAPLPSDLDVIGYVRLELFARSSLAYTDFVGRLCDVGPGGKSTNVCEGNVRVTPGVGELQPDGSLRLELDLQATAQRFRAGHRIRLHVASAAHPRWSLNSGDGRPLAAGAPTGLPAEQTVFHDLDHPSALILPIVSDATRRAMGGDNDR